MKMWISVKSEILSNFTIYNIIQQCLITGGYALSPNNSLSLGTSNTSGNVSVYSSSPASLFSSTLLVAVNNIYNRSHNLMPPRKPPFLHGINSNVAKGSVSFVIYNCSEVISQLPDNIVTTETDSPGSSLVNITASSELHFKVNVVSPVKIASILDDNFNITISNNITQHLTLVTSVDIDGIYEKTKVIASSITLQLRCENRIEKIFKLLNVTVIDMDDNSPKFNVKTKGDCIFPVYKADVTTDYMGVVYPKPRTIKAVDGDTLINNNVTYSIIHGNPIEYTKFFTFDQYDATINKTAKVSETDPQSFTLAIQATEDSIEGRSSMALLSISLFIVTDGTDEATKVNETVLLALRILSVIVILAFAIGMIIIVRHRCRRHCAKTKPAKQLTYQSSHDILILEDLENETSLVEWTKHDVINNDIKPRTGVSQKSMNNSMS